MLLPITAPLIVVVHTSVGGGATSDAKRDQTRGNAHPWQFIVLSTLIFNSLTHPYTHPYTQFVLLLILL